MQRFGKEAKMKAKTKRGKNRLIYYNEDNLWKVGIINWDKTLLSLGNWVPAYDK